MRGADVTGARRSRRGRRLILGVVGAVALMAATAVMALANYLETLAFTNGCVDTYTQVTATIGDPTTGSYLVLDLNAYDSNTGKYVLMATSGQINMVPGTYTYDYWFDVTSVPPGVTATSWFASPYTKWEVAWDSSSHGVVQNGVEPVSTSVLCTPVPNTPESPLAVALPIAGLAIFAGAFGFAIRRRRNSASAG